jgi:hypothetical protein
MYINDTWELTLAPGEERWEIAIDGNEPDPFWLGRYGHSAVLDVLSNRMIIFGGGGTGGERNDTWALSLSDLESPPHWTQIETQGTLPLSRQGQTAVWDAIGHRMILFSGARGGVMAPFAETWQLDFGFTPPKWTKLAFSGATPPARWWHAAVFDPSQRRMVVFGGDTKTRFLNDLWVLDLNDTPTWTQLTPTGTLPGARALHSLALDEKNDRIIVFGGDASSGYDYNDVWALSLADPTRWDLVMAGGSSLAIPEQRSRHVAAYDTLNDRMLVYGGCSDGNQIDLWSFSDRPGPPHWTQLSAPGGPPRQRCGRTAVLDQARGAWILYGGTAGAASNTLWNLRWDVPVPVQITYASVRRHNEAVVLEWRTSELNQGTFCVDRALPGQPRARISQAVPSTSTGYSFRDSSDPPVGTLYYLELLDRAGGTTTFGPYELLDGPGAPSAAPRLTATPNPFRLGVKLSAHNLPVGELSIEVCSVAGRVVRREPPIEGFGGGNAEFQVLGLDELPAGMYFVRVRVGAEVVSSRLVKLQ